MLDKWYYAAGETTMGPLGLTELKVLLDGATNWQGLMVWRAGFTQWQTAGSVREIRLLYEFPPPIVSTVPPTLARPKRALPHRIILGIIVLAAAMAFGAFGLIFFQRVRNVQSTASSTMATPGIEGEIAGALDKIRSGLPRKIDATTILTGVRNLNAQLIFENIVTTDFSKFDDATKDRLRQSVVRNVCGNAETRKILDIGGSFRYVYTDLQTRPVFDIDVLKTSCP